MSTFTARTFTMAFNDARAIGLLNDAGQDVYTDAVLLPHGAAVFQEIQEEFAANGIPFIETSTESLTYTAAATTIVVPAGVTDLSAPLEIWEKGSTDEQWVPMKRVMDLRPPLQTSRTVLGQWEWRNGTIVVLACSANRDIWCRYRRQLAYPTAASTMGLDGIYTALVAGTALRAGTNRPDVQAAAAQQYATALNRSIHIASRDRQGITYQQRSWGRGRGYVPIQISQD